MIEIVDYLGIVIGAISLAPQVLQMYNTKKVEDINFFFIVISILSDILYFIYSIYEYDLVFFVSVIPPTISHTIMLILYLMYKKKSTVLSIENKKTEIKSNDSINLVA